MVSYPWEQKIVDDIDGLKSFYSSLKAFSGADFSER